MCLGLCTDFVTVTESQFFKEACTYMLCRFSFILLIFFFLSINKTQRLVIFLSFHQVQYIIHTNYNFAQCIFLRLCDTCKCYRLCRLFWVKQIKHINCIALLNVQYHVQKQLYEKSIVVQIFILIFYFLKCNYLVFKNLFCEYEYSNQGCTQIFHHCNFFLLLSRGLMPRTLDSQITMEKTPSYFVTREAPRRIASMSQDTKLIVVVRNPVTRAISDYTQTQSKKPDIPSFEELAFKNRSQGLVDTSWNAIRIGMYILHLENWLQYFRLSQIHFVSGERLITDPAGELGRVQDFLGLKRIITDKHFYFNRTKGFPCLKKPESSSTPRCLGKSKGRTHVQIDQEVIEQLRDFYRPFNVKFYETVGHDFRWDWGDKLS